VIVNKKPQYIKPEITICGVEIDGLICTSPNTLSNVSFYSGGGGVYDGKSIWNNGDDY